MASMSASDWSMGGEAAVPFGRQGANERRIDERDVRRGAFAGSGSEYFGIWIVNVILSVLTLGIYSAWAKVRNERYFKGHTYVAGHNFDYHAKPSTILVGRIVAVLAFVAFNMAAEIDPRIAVALLVLYLFALPWIIVRGLAFNARMTSHRNVRFGFEGKKRHAAMAFIAWPVLSVLSLGLLVPFASRSVARFIGGHRYGTARFHADPSVKSYYGALARTLPLVLVVALLGVVVAWGAMDAVMGIGIAGPIQILFFAASYALIFVVPVWYRTLARNITVDAMVLEGGHRLVSDMRPLAYLGIMVTNAVLIVATLGLATPWARVRVARYKAAHTGLVPAGDLDGFVDAEQSKGGVASGEFLDMDGFELGL